MNGFERAVTVSPPGTHARAGDLAGTSASRAGVPQRRTGLLRCGEAR